MRRTPKLALLAATALAVPLFVTPASAQHYDGGLTVTCKDVNLTGTGPHVLDRDNTGEGQEAFTVRAYDGAHNLLVDFHFTNNLGSYPGGLGNVAFTSYPTANPITVYVLSDAGNGLLEESQTIGTGTCDIRPPLTLDPSATTEPPTTEAPTTETTIVDETTTTVMPTTTATPTTVKRNGNVRPATGAKPRSGNARYTG